MGADDGSPDRVRRRWRLPRPGASLRRSAKLRVSAALVALGALVLLAVGFGLQGSSSTIPAGVTLAGIDVSGLTAEAALAELGQRSAAAANEPIVIVANAKGVRLTPAEAALDVNWEPAIERAIRSGEAFGPLQGWKRLALRAVGRDIRPSADVRRKVIREKVELLTAHLDDPAEDPSLRLDGVEIVLEPGRGGNRIPVGKAIALVREALVDLDAAAVELPVERVEADVAEARLAHTRELLDRALSEPVTVELGESTFNVSPERIAPMLRVRSTARGGLAIAGPEAKAFFKELTALAKIDAIDAQFNITDEGAVEILPHTNGRKLDLADSEAALLAALEGDDRAATLVMKLVEPELTTERAQSLGIVDVVGTYTTSYGGEVGRLANVRLVSRLVDDHLIAPGELFSFNETTGERNAQKGFVDAPVIINGEVETALGGGVCQVSTTVYNAAYEAGLGIERRVNHALYLDYYPTGRDATVDFPRIDMQFRNDTENWLLLRTEVDDNQLTVTLYGTPVHREVITKTSKLQVIERPEIEFVKDWKVRKGRKKLKEKGAPSREVSVRRIVKSADGDVLYDDRWDSSYVSKVRVVGLGAKKPRKERKGKKEEFETPPADPGTQPAEPSAPPAESESPPADEGDLPVDDGSTALTSA